MEDAGDLICQPQGRVVFSFFKKYDGLPTHSCFLSEFGLSYPFTRPEFFYPGIHEFLLVYITFMVKVGLKQDSAYWHEDNEHKKD